MELQRLPVQNHTVISEVLKSGGTEHRRFSPLHLPGNRMETPKYSNLEVERRWLVDKKYGKRTPLSEPITNLYLTENEYGSLSALPGHRARKRRYALPCGSLDVYLEPSNGPAILEVEFADEMAAGQFEPPAFVTCEITSDPAFSGASIAALVTGS